jgi:hypothetical protein
LFVRGGALVKGIVFNLLDESTDAGGRATCAEDAWDDLLDRAGVQESSGSLAGRAVAGSAVHHPACGLRR